MEYYFNSKTGHITKESDQLGEVSVTVDDARSAWLSGEVSNSNISFHRLAAEFDFDVQACLDWYKAQS